MLAVLLSIIELDGALSEKSGTRFNLKFHRSETLFHREIKSENEGNTARMLVEYVAM